MMTVTTVVSLLLEAEDLMFSFLNDDIQPDAEISGHDVHHPEASYNHVTISNDLNLRQ